MTTRDEFVRAVGLRLLHVTARSNLPGIQRHGLLSPASLAHLAGQDAASLTLRKTRVVLRLQDGTTAQLNHQLPIVHGLRAANCMVEGHDAQSWAHQLDHRVYFWPEKYGQNFAASVARDTDSALIWFETARLFDLASERLWLSPINSGNFRQGGANARRGNWLYCSAAGGIDAFRTNRQRRGLIKGKDRVYEVSITGDLSGEAVAAIQ